MAQTVDIPDLKVSIDFPDDLDQDQIQEAIYQAFPTYRPHSSVWGAGVEMARQAYEDVGTVAKRFVAGAEASREVKHTQPEATTAVPYQERWKEEQEQRKALRTQREAEDASKEAERARTLDVLMPPYDPEKPVSSIARRGAATAIGVLGELPLYAAGGIPARAVAEAVIGGSQLIARTGRAAVETAGQFAGESLLRGKSPTETGGATATGAVVGTARELAPPKLKLLAESFAFLGAEKFIQGHDVGVQDYADILGTLVALRAITKAGGKVLEAKAKPEAPGEKTEEFKPPPASEIKVGDEVTKPAEIVPLERAQTTMDAELRAPLAEKGEPPATEGTPREGITDAARAEEAKRLEPLTREAIKRAVDLTSELKNIAPQKAEMAKQVLSSPEGLALLKQIEEKPERRVNLEKRKQIEEMSPDELRTALAIDSLTGVKSRYHYETREKAPYQVILDLDGLKAVNDHYGYKAGDILIARMGTLLKEGRYDANRYGGDEFVVQAKTKAEASAIRKRILADAAKAEFEVQLPEGEKGTFQGIGVSIGIGKDFKSAEDVLKVMKATRAQARGTLPEAYARRQEEIKAAAREPKVNPTISAPESGAGKEKGAVDLDLLVPPKVQEAAARLNSEIKGVLKALKIEKELKEKRAEMEPEFAELDRFNRFHATMLTLLQNTDMNPHISGLRSYVDQVRTWSADKNKGLEVADLRVKEIYSIGAEEQHKLGKVLYGETLRGERFAPESKEIQALRPETRTLREKIIEDFSRFLEAVRLELKLAANRKLQGPALDAELKAIDTDFDAMQKKPYFPLARFGQHTLKVTTEAGELVSFETFESEVSRRVAYYKKLRELKPGERAIQGYVPDDFLGFQGMPPRLVERIVRELKLEPDKERALLELAYAMAPEQSFRKHLMERKDVPGYSEDFVRAYANYFFHGANHLGRLKHGDQLLESIAQVSESARRLEEKGIDNASRNKIVEYMREHYDYIMSPKNELAGLRSFAFLWYLGLVPKAAFVNLTQPVLVTYPYLAARYGEKAATVMGGAYKDISMAIAGRNKLTADEAKALDRGLEEGLTDQSFASVLAGVADGDFLSKALPATEGGRSIRDLSGKAALLFTLAEQYNRRVTLLSAYRLARKAGAEHEAAYLAGREALEKTQYEYANWNRAKFMQGKVGGTAFVFFQFLQNTLYFLKRDPGAARAVAILAAAAGIQGLPFAEDVLDIIDKVLGTENKRHDSRKELRDFVIELGANPDLIMHGGARFGFGIPWIARQTGIPWPDFDVSASLSMGRPVPPTAVLSHPAGDFSGQVTASLQSAGGAVVSIPLSIWQAMADDSPLTMKRIEKALPNFAENLSKAYRYLKEEREQLPDRATLTDLEHPVGAAISQGMGFTPTEITQAHERRWQIKETQAFYLERRRRLLSDYDYALEIKEKDAIRGAQEAVSRYNHEVPYKSMAITGEDLRSSIKRRATNRALEGEGLYGGKKGSEISQDVSRSYPSSP